MKVKNKPIYITCLLSTTLLLADHANATFIMTLDQVGPDVVASGSGTVNTAALSLFCNGCNTRPFVSPNAAFLAVGATPANVIDLYALASGPTQFGSGSNTLPSTGSGHLAGIGSGLVIVPMGYVSGTPLSGQDTYNNTTLAALGVTTGTYTWTWGSGVDADSLTLYAGVPVPTAATEPGSLLLMAGGFAALGIFPVRKLRVQRSN